MARKSSPSDSLELLLDTICNTFGGILFIAILVVILLQMSGEQLAEERPDREVVSMPELEDLRQQLAVVHGELHRLRALALGQEQTIAAFAPDDVQALLAEREATTQSRDNLREERDQLIAQMAERAENIERIEGDIRDVHANFDNTERRVQELRDQLAEEREARRQELRTPVVRSSGLKQELGVVLQYGRLYVWHRYDRSGNRLGLNTEEFIVVSDDADGITTTPRPTAGIVVDGTDESRRAISDRLRTFNPRSFYVSVVARPDSFAEFQHLRAALTESGFEYRLIPMTANGAVFDRGGTDSRVQ